MAKTQKQTELFDRLDLAREELCGALEKLERVYREMCEAGHLLTNAVSDHVDSIAGAIDEFQNDGTIWSEE